MSCAFAHFGPGVLLPVNHCGYIDDGIMLSRFAAVVILQAASEEADLYHYATLPAACSEHFIFSDAWLCWCFAELDIPALEVHFTAEIDADKHARALRWREPIHQIG
jgi:hypothetical protein